MGISSNQARFLALTSRQVDLEHRIQQICQRRLRLSSELENTATSYNNDISNRKLFAMNTSNGGISNIGYSTTGSYTKLTDFAGKAIEDSNGNPYYLGGTKGVLPTDNVKASSITSVKPDATNAFEQDDGEVITYAELGLSSGATAAECIEAGLRSGLLSIAALSDEFSQQNMMIVSAPGQPGYELVDWRTVPSLADELYKGDDVDAENKYDKTIAEINAQDKKLQLEQTSIEVEYKAITSEKESVKKILDTNAQTSFKYFS